MAITPQAVDFYSRYMDALFDEKDIIGVSTVWQQFFGKPAHGNSKTIYSPNSEVIDIDIMRANERLAAMVHRGIDSRMLNIQRNTTTQNFSTFSRVYPLCEELGDISASQINKRVAGENPYDAMSREARIRILAREHHLEHIRRYVRLFEALAGMSVLGGQMPAILGSGNADNWYDFRRNASLIVSPALPWDDPAKTGEMIIADIDAGCRALRETGHVKPNVMFLGQNVSAVFFGNTGIQTWANIYGFSFFYAGTEGFALPANLQPLVDAGANVMGKLMTPEGNVVFIFTYVDGYNDDAGDFQHYMPLNTVLLAYYGARCDRYFGPPERLPLTSADAAWYQEMFGMNINAPGMPSNIKGGGIVTPGMFYCDAYRSGDNKKVTVRTQSAPIFATTQTDAFYTLYNCLTRSS